MGIRANGVFGQKSLANYSRENGDSSKWEFCQIAKLLRKWEDLDKNLVKQQSFRDENTYFYVNGNRKALLTFREKMDIRANGDLE